MTVYLATTSYLGLADDGSAELLTEVFCSWKCRRDAVAVDRRVTARLALDYYEFDEACANCGQLIPASPLPLSTTWDGTINDDGTFNVGEPKTPRGVRTSC